MGLWPTPGYAQQRVQGVEPEQNSVVARATDTVAVALSSVRRDLQGSDTLTVFGSRFGRHEGTTEVTSDSIRFISDCPFRPGETVTVTVDERVSSALSTPYVWQFTVRSEYGRGTFSRENSVSFGQQGQEKQVAKLGSVEIPSEPFAADLNRPDDLQTDVAFVNQEAEEVQVLYGPDLDGSDSQTVSVTGATTLAGGDLNNDGLPDLVAVSSFSDNLTVLVNQEGTFQKGPQISTGSRPTDVAVGDFDGDGAQDLAVAPFGEDEVEVYVNQDNDNNIAFQSEESYPVGAAPTSLTARDVDRDGALDLLVGSSGEERIDVLGNDEQGHFPQNAPLRDSVDVGFVPASISANDVSGNNGPETGDGFMDLTVSGQGQNEMVLVENDPTDSFGFRAPTTLSSTPNGPALGMALSDVDAGRSQEEGVYDLDLLSTYRSSDSLQLLPNSSNNGYGTPSSFSGRSNDPVGITDFDVDRDGDQDFTVINPRGTSLDLFTNQGGRPGPVTLDPSSINFEEICVGNDSTETIQIENMSPNRVEIDSSVVPEGFGVRSTSGTLPDTLRPGEIRVVEVTFEPRSITDYNDQLVLRANELTQFCGRETPPTELPIQVRGTGLGIEVSASPEVREFGEVIEGNSSTESFTIQNQGNDDADVQEIRGLDGTPFEVVNSPSTVLGSGQEQVTVRFAPTEANASYEETVRVTLESRNCDQQQTVEVTLRGSSRPPRPDLVAEEVFVEEDDPSPIRVSDTLSVRCRYSNQGGTRVDDSFEWQIRQDGTVLESRTDNSNPEVGGTRETRSVSVEFSSEGPVEITCEVDSEAQITEQGEDNNTAVLDLTVELPDQLPVQPNPFTPNGDEVNESVGFLVNEFGLDQPTVEIYTFEGRLIRTLSEVTSGKVKWDGTSESGEEQPPGVYLYVVRDGGQDVASGQVTLAR
ncbi:FG-GAP-like repeat-containing protein [Salinibacter grassmerensis]|uniref:FG-GAP-like repeat-containing protein n=1 Tax=Salinibacter grassmerensis TaxID=3040353 RepID=UPI0021E847DD|nr:FG-GAP-like repeat-containing protein [Salinibacter grassmerensis]